MMKALWVLSLSSFLFLGCSMPSRGLSSFSYAQVNVVYMDKLVLGMSEKQVFEIMKAPYRYESFLIGGDVYDMWFYITKPAVLGQTRLVPQNLTPLAFKNGILIGCGYRFYNYLHQASLAKKEYLEESTPAIDLTEPSPPSNNNADEEDRYRAMRQSEMMEERDPWAVDDYDFDEPSEMPEWRGGRQLDLLDEAKNDVFLSGNDPEDTQPRKKPDNSKKKSQKSSFEEESPPDEKGREMLEDDAEDDFDTW